MMQLLVSAGGSIRCIYGEQIDLSALGRLRIGRASHVEPDGWGWWWADLGPVGGPRLGPYRQRSGALAAERCWLEQNLGGLVPPQTEEGGASDEGCIGSAAVVVRAVVHRELFGPGLCPVLGDGDGGTGGGS